MSRRNSPSGLRVKIVHTRVCHTHFLSPLTHTHTIDQIGGVEFADVLIDYNGRSKGCGIVEFASNEEAKRAVKELQGFDFDGREIFLREDREPTRRTNGGRGRGGRGRGRGGRGRGGRGAPRGGPRGGSIRKTTTRPQREETGGDTGRQVYVGNLSWTTTKEAIDNKFAEFGAIETVTLESDFKGRSKGWATVLFEDKESSDAAVAAMDGVEFEGRPLKVHVDRFFVDSKNSGEEETTQE